ncbi:MAG: 5-oxoprolinase subunit PxpB [Gloeobacteraceae cyanobacterium ES-bin-144]|nr:5-oxoprolinase subunit PxpB [Verrucomicrobiales bacterium]
MGWRALGDSAWLYEPGGTDAEANFFHILGLRNQLETSKIPEIHDVVSSFASLAVHFDPSVGETVLEWILTQTSHKSDSSPADPRTITIEVEYGGEDGPDLTAIAAALGMSERKIIELHSTPTYTVAAVGFSPGFPYLLGLPETLNIPRLSTPRRVPAGSVAIAGGQAGIYPNDSQGGWHLLGRTRFSLFNPNNHEPSSVRPGDRVKFLPIIHQESLAHTRETAAESNEGSLEVLDPGALSSVQDLGRHGYQSIGVSPGGATDPESVRVANRLVGNPDHAAVIECCLQGAHLKFHQTTRAVFIGWHHEKNGSPIQLNAGDEVDLRTRMIAARGYIAISGGIQVPLLLGSRATDIRAKLGGHHGRFLKSGDLLPIGNPNTGPQTQHWKVTWPLNKIQMQTLTLRFIAGVQSNFFTSIAHELFRSATFEISQHSDRTGTRLNGPVLGRRDTAEMISQPVVQGSIQVPPDGRPIILLAERQTIGGYPQIGHIISADLPVIARAMPGTFIRFQEVSLHAARDAWRQRQHEFRILQVGLDLLH